MRLHAGVRQRQRMPGVRTPAEPDRRLAISGHGRSAPALISDCRVQHGGDPKPRPANESPAVRTLRDGGDSGPQPHRRARVATQGNSSSHESPGNQRCDQCDGEAPNSDPADSTGHTGPPNAPTSSLMVSTLVDGARGRPPRRDRLLPLGLAIAVGCLLARGRLSPWPRRRTAEADWRLRHCQV